MWARLDDNFPDHPKVRSLGVFGIALQAAAICYCSRYLTDGFLSHSVADQLIASISSPFTLPDGQLVTVEVTGEKRGPTTPPWNWKARMIEVGLWEKTKGGILVHDYLKYNPTRASVLKERERTAGRVAKLRGQREGGGVSNAVTYPQACNAVTTPVVRRSRPRPIETNKAFDLKGEGSGDHRGAGEPTPLGSILAKLGPRPTMEQDQAAREAALQALKAHP
jgi:hypothetical protein